MKFLDFAIQNQYDNNSFDKFLKEWLDKLHNRTRVAFISDTDTQNNLLAIKQAIQIRHKVKENFEQLEQADLEELINDLLFTLISIQNKEDGYTE